MKQFWKAFFLRGAICAAGGPLVLVIVYGNLGATGVITYLSYQEVCLAILSIALLAFVIAGMSAIYQQERLPLSTAICIHGGSLYLVYILVYLLNGWLQLQLIPVLVFTGVFFAGYALIWLIIYSVHKHKADKLNEALKS